MNRKSLTERRVYLWNPGWRVGGFKGAFIFAPTWVKNPTTACNVSSAFQRGAGGSGSSGDDRKSRRVCFAAAHPQFVTLVGVNHNCIKRVGTPGLSTNFTPLCRQKQEPWCLCWCVFNGKQLDSYVSGDYLLLVTFSIPDQCQRWIIHTHANSNLTFLLDAMHNMFSVSLSFSSTSLNTSTKRRVIEGRAVYGDPFLSYTVFLLRDNRCVLLLYCPAFMIK